MSRARVRSLLAALRPYPFEVVAIGMAVVALVVLRAAGLRYGWNTMAFTFPPLLVDGPRILLLGLALGGVQSLLARRPLREFAGTVLRPSWMLLWLRCWLASTLLVYTYTWVKVSIPLLRSTLYDTQLWHLDRWLHFGLSPSVFAVELVAGTPLAGWFDAWYALWIPILLLLMSRFFALERADLRRNFTLAATLLWTIGAWIYVAIPAVGPCYASPDVLEPIRDQIPRAVISQRVLWENYLTMVRGRGGMLAGFQPLFGVAAMPSLHVGAHALVLFWARRHERWLLIPAIVATGLTFLGSVVTGWHYAVDGYAGLLLAWLAVRIADRFEPVHDLEPDSVAAAPAGPVGAGAPPEASGSIGE